MVVIILLLTLLSGCTSQESTEKDNNTGEEESETSSDGENNSAQYWFKADIHHYSHNRPKSELFGTTIYEVGASAYWKPVSYVQYYEIKVVFNGNLPEDFSWSGDYRDKDTSSGLKSPYFLNEGYIYHIDGNPDIKGFLGVMSSGDCTTKKIDPDTGETNEWVYARLWPKNYDGFDIFSVHTTIDEDEDLSSIQIGSIIGEMETYVQEYVNNWEIWIRGVTETKEC